MRNSLLLRAVQAMQTVKPHIPLIKFRKGQHDISSSAKPTVSKKTPTSVKDQKFFLIAEEQLPLRFRRQLLDERQISAINSGGIE